MNLKSSRAEKRRAAGCRLVAVAVAVAAAAVVVAVVRVLPVEDLGATQIHIRSRPLLLRNSVV